MAGAEIGIIPNKVVKEFEVFLPTDTDDISKALLEHLDAEALYLASPNFEGLISDYKAISSKFGH